MDFATLLGFFGGIIVILTVILMGGNIGVLVDLHPVIIVLGGTIAVVLMKFSLQQCQGAFHIAAHTLFSRLESPEQILEQLMQLAEKARKEGVLTLEQVKVKNKFLQHGIQYLVDGVSHDMLELALTHDLNQTIQRHVQGRQIFKAIADVGPAMGMIGTLIGLVQMLSHMSDPKAIGPAMAVAMLATLYGALQAHLFALPIAEKLELRSNEERLIKCMIIDGIMSIQEGQNPRMIREILNAYLPSSKRKKPRK